MCSLQFAAGSTEYKVSSEQYEMGFTHFIGSNKMNKYHFILLTLYSVLPAAIIDYALFKRYFLTVVTRFLLFHVIIKVLLVLSLRHQRNTSYVICGL